MQKANILKIQQYIVHKGWAVIPGNLKIVAGQKQVDLKSPYWTKEDDKGLDDPVLVEKVFKNKNAIGVITGYKSGITVIDIDVNKKTGKTYTDLSVFPETYTVKTQSGGYHLYYQYYSDMASKANVGGDTYKKVDCRNDGGFVFAPPTRGYKIVNDTEPQPFPVEYFNGIKEAKKATTKYKGLKNIKNFKGMEEGERDTALFTFAEHGYRTNGKRDWPHIDTAICIFNKEMKVPLSDIQVSKIMDSARKYSDHTEKDLEFEVNQKTGIPKLLLTNVVQILQHDNQFKNRIRANTFSGTLEIFNKKNEWEVVRKAFETELRLELGEKYKFMTSMPRIHVEDAISYIAIQNQISPIKEHMKKLIWDKKSRLNQWIHRTYKVTNTPYYKEMGHHYLVGLVNRIFWPGCQMDNAIVLDGVEGFGKSQSLRALCDFEGLGVLFNETSESPDGKDFAISLLGSLITEFAEGAVFDYKDRKKVKSFISKIFDKYRPPYERTSLDFPRQGVFAMSTNDSQYLEDRGINRRWWPVVLDRDTDGVADIKWLEDNKEQLYAEAVAKIKDNFWSFTPEAQMELDLLREEKKVEDETLAPVFDWYLGLDEYERDEGVTKRQGYDAAEFIKDPTDFDLKKIGELYTDALHLKPGRKKRNGVMKRVFLPTIKTPNYDV